MDEYARLRSALTRYRVMFKIAIALVIGGVAMSVVGLYTALTTASTAMLIAGLLFVLWNGMFAYKMVLSTMRLLDDARARGIDLSPTS